MIFAGGILVGCFCLVFEVFYGQKRFISANGKT